VAQLTGLRKEKLFEDLPPDDFFRVGEPFAQRDAPFDFAVRLTGEPFILLPCSTYVRGVAHPLSKLPASTFLKAQVRAHRVCFDIFQTGFQLIPMRLEASGKGSAD
jgi:hypothetical protein